MNMEDLIKYLDEKERKLEKELEDVRLVRAMLMEMIEEIRKQ